MGDDPPRHKTATALGLPSRRPGTVSDGRPVEVDPEVTPRPATIEDIRLLPIHQQLATVVEGLNQNSKAIAYEQDQRNEARRHGEAIATMNDRLTRMEPALVSAHRTATTLDEMRIQARDVAVNVQNLIRAQERDEVRREEADKQITRLIESVGGVDERARRIERQQDRTEDEVRSLKERVEGLSVGLSSRVTASEQRLSMIEHSRSTERAVQKALTRREKTALTVGVFGGFAGLAAAVWKIISHFTAS